MSCVVLERVLDMPVSAHGLRKMAQDAAGCLALYNVDYYGSLVGDGGKRVTCFYTAPDAESVRTVNRQGDLPFERAWAAEIHGPEDGDPISGGAAGASCVVVERAFTTPIVFDEVQAQEDRHAWCLEAHGVRFLRTYFAVDRRRMLCLYAAPDAEAVRHVQIQAGLPFERVWPAEIWRLQE